ncbi:hypothetical protein GKZ28_09915 [Clostridium chromiireducens]|uniref:Sortilin N-terminal domain-containing protein n=1 Tax=Clostridium chromiireducens TaxID=225345 RepID=A0A964RLX0_9CLOT|nr:YCF48-related protein [Clostridium chromiireducens]MVX64008.1 hypothetical protein [Clostridium chromiireducens]
MKLITKKIIAIMCSFTLVSISLYGCVSASGKGNKEPDWEIVKTIEIEQKSNIGGFYDDNFGITAGYNGEVHYTNDGGKSWPKGNNTSFCRFGLFIVNDKVAYTCGNGNKGGHVRKTSDGGRNWEEVSNFGESEPNQCRYLSFVDENIGWIAAPKKLGMTKDSGKTWSEIKLPDGIDDITAIDLLNEDNGYLIDKNNNLYITKDLGQTWSIKKINIKNINTSIYSETNTSYLRFFDEKKAVFFYYNKEKNLNCSYTYDGGDTWEEKILPNVIGKGLYLSSDGKILSVNSDNAKQITILKQK